MQGFFVGWVNNHFQGGCIMQILSGKPSAYEHFVSYAKIQVNSGKRSPFLMRKPCPFLHVISLNIETLISPTKRLFSLTDFAPFFCLPLNDCFCQNGRFCPRDGLHNTPYVVLISERLLVLITYLYIRSRFLRPF